MSAATSGNNVSAETAKIVAFRPVLGGSRKKTGPRAKYYYPREAIEQRGFTVNGYGQKLPSSMSIFMLSNKEFVSQIEILLSQLTNEGYDVSGPDAELRAMREIICQFDTDLVDVADGLFRLRRKRTEPSFEYSDQHTPGA